MEKSTNDVSGIIVDAAYRLHRRLGPGLLESVYESILANDLARSGLNVQRQKTVTFEFEGQLFRDGLRVDLLIENAIVVEIKSVESLAPVHSKQILTYLRLLDLRVGLLINFGSATLKEGIRRLVNNYTPSFAAAPAPPRLRANFGALGPSEKTKV